MLAQVLEDHIRWDIKISRPYLWCSDQILFVTYLPVFTGVKGMLEGFQHIVGNSLKVKPTKGSSSPKVRGMYSRTQGYMSAANLVTWG